jgi:hypothetical protein
LWIISTGCIANWRTRVSQNSHHRIFPEEEQFGDAPQQENELFIRIDPSSFSGQKKKTESQPKCFFIVLNVTSFDY